MMNIGESGKFGEDTAAEYLRKKGYKIVKRNYSCRLGEIDIIAEDENYLVFAEVKLRKNDRYGEAREFVNYSKQRRIIRTASLYLSQHETEKQPRFDVIEVYAPNGISSPVTVNHLENAFM